MPRKSSEKPETTKDALLDQIKTIVEDSDLVVRRRKQITSASIETFCKLGYHPATIRDVAKHANVSVGLIYQYVGDKEDLLFLALVEILTEYKRVIPRALEGLTDPLERFIAAVRVYCRTHGSPVDPTVLAYRESASLRKERRDAIKQLELETNELVAACIRDCIAVGVFTKDTDVELFTYQIVMYSHAWALKSWNFAAKMNVEEYLDRGLHLMLNGVITDSGLQLYKRLKRRPRAAHPKESAQKAG
jgi:AcrR family transcriptional regulator